MAGKCDICGKTLTFGCRVSHSNRHTNHAWKPNIQSVKMVVDGKRRRVNICTRCLRSQHKINRRELAKSSIL